jgi:iron complex outermembrane recepter protein
VPDRLKLTIGSKLEHNDFSGFEVQPSARLIWSIDKRQAVWTAVSRAVRTPTQLDEDVRIIEGPVTVLGNPDFVSEDVVAYELGYRVQPTESLGFDIATYYNNYDNLRSLDLVGTTFFIGNKLAGQTYGAEIGSTWKATSWWTFRGAYTYLKVQLQNDPGSTDITSVATAGNDPQSQVYVRSSMDLPHDIQLDCSMRYVSDLPNQHVPAYVAVDARIAWQATRQLQLAIVGQNLFDNEHPESGTGVTQHVIPRGVYGMFTYQW